MVKPERHPEVAVQPIHFEDRSGTEFERLCFAYLLRAFEWKAIDCHRPEILPCGRSRSGPLDRRDWPTSPLPPPA